MPLDNRELDAREMELAQSIWDYMDIGKSLVDLPQSEAILVLGSPDTLPAERAAQLFYKGVSDRLVFCGNKGRNSEILPRWKAGMTEARMLSEVAIEKGVPRVCISLEEKSTNSGENIRFSKEIIDNLEIKLEKLVVVHMPSSLRRDYATLVKQWPEPKPTIVMAGPNVPFRDYHERGYQGTMSRADIVSDMLGDFQRLFVYANKHSIPVEEIDGPCPMDIKNAYYELVDRGYGQHQLIKDDKGMAVEI